MSAPSRATVAARELSVEMLIAPEWSRIDAVRSVIDAIVRATGPSTAPELTRRLAMVAGELMENALKYGKDGERVAFQMRRDGHAIVLSVTNVIDPATESSTRLQARVAWLSAFDSSLAAYHATIARLDSDPTVDGAGLGLARILFEGESRLSCEVRQDGTLAMHASQAWPTEEEQAA